MGMANRLRTASAGTIAKAVASAAPRHDEPRRLRRRPSRLIWVDAEPSDEVGPVPIWRRCTARSGRRPAPPPRGTGGAPTIVSRRRRSDRWRDSWRFGEHLQPCDIARRFGSWALSTSGSALAPAWRWRRGMAPGAAVAGERSPRGAAARRWTFGESIMKGANIVVDQQERCLLMVEVGADRSRRRR